MNSEIKVQDGLNPWQRSVVDELTGGARSWLLPGERLYHLPAEDYVHRRVWRAGLGEMVRRREVLVVAGPIERRQGCYAIVHVLRPARRFTSARALMIYALMAYVVAVAVCVILIWKLLAVTLTVCTLGWLFIMWRTGHKATCPGLHCPGCKG